MKNKRGFVFIETIITVVVLTTSLLYLYNSYSSIISSEEERLYYDNPAYIYRTNYIREFLESYSNIDYIKDFAFDNSYIITIGPYFDDIFTAEQMDADMIASLVNIFNNYKVNQMLLMDTTMLNDCTNSQTDDDILTKCDASTKNLSYNLNRYIRTINDTTYSYYLIVEYSEITDTESGRISRCTPGVNTECSTYYASLGL